MISVGIYGYKSVRIRGLIARGIIDSESDIKE